MKRSTLIELLKIPDVLSDKKCPGYHVAWDVAELENNTDTRNTFSLAEIQDNFGYSFKSLKQALTEAIGSGYVRIVSPLEQALRKE